MRYFGIPTCPYCKKRVNLIRTWSLKRQGEYRCPRCGGIANIYLSPLVFVFALIAVFAGVAIYFFHKFILDDIALDTCLQVLVPFALFFLLSLFVVYLEKPVIKKVPREQVDKKRRPKGQTFESRRMPQQGETGRVFFGQEDYYPQKPQNFPGPMPAEDEDMKIVAPKEVGRPLGEGEAVERSSVVPAKAPEVSQTSRVPQTSQAPSPVPSPAQVRAQAGAAVQSARQAAPQPVSKPVSQPAPAAAVQAAAPAAPKVQAASQPVSKPVSQPAPAAAVQAAAPAAPKAQAAPQPVSKPVSQPAPAAAVQAAAPAAPKTQAAPQPVSKPVSQPSPAPAEAAKASSQDYFAKYDDPEYISRRLAELRRERAQQEGKGQ